MRDRVEPGRQLGLAAEARQRAMRAQKGFLGDLLGLGGIAEHPERHAEDAVLIRPDELLERAVVAGPEPIEKPRGLGIIVSLHDKTIARGQSSRRPNVRNALLSA